MTVRTVTGGWLQPLLQLLLLHIAASGSVTKEDYLNRLFYWVHNLTTSQKQTYNLSNEYANTQSGYTCPVTKSGQRLNL